MGYLFILRHGPVVRKNHHRELDHNEYKKIVHRIVRIINKYDNVDIIYTSPIDRCIDTAVILNKYFDVRIKKTDNLLRCGEGQVKCSKRLRNCKKFGKKIARYDDNVLIVTHSSVIRGVMNGVSGKKIKKFKVNRASLTIYDKDREKFVVYNKGF